MAERKNGKAPEDAFLSATRNPVGISGRKETAPLPFRSIEDLIIEEPTEPPWLWRGFLVPSAITLVSGKPKVGKSSLVAALLPKLGGGEPFLGLATRPTRVALLTEESSTTVVEKVRRFGRPPLDVLCWSSVAERPWAEVAALAAEYARGHGADLLVVDTFNAFSGLRGDEENQAGAVLQAMAPLRAATTRGLAVLLVAHERKSGGANGDAVRGSGALVGAVDIAVSLSRSKLGASVRALESVSRFVGTPAELLIDLRGDEYRVLGDVAAARAELDGEQILTALARLGEADIATLAVETGIPPSTLRRRLRTLEDVEASGEGKRGAPERFRLKETA